MNSRTFRPALVAAVLTLATAVPAAAEFRVEKNLKLDPGETLTVVSDVGSVEVTGTASPGAHVVLTAKDDDFASKYDMAFDEIPGGVKIVVKKKHGADSWFGLFTTRGASFDIQVPAKTRADIQTGGGHVRLASLEGNAKADTSGGHIEVDGLRGALVANTSGGHIALRDVTGDARVQTSGGHIEATGIGGGLWAETSGGHIELRDIGKDIHAETSGGGIEIEGARGRVVAETSGGHVRVSFAKGNDRGGKIESSGGGITVALDPQVNLNLDASTSAGTVSTDVPIKVVGRVTKSAIRGTLGSGGETLEVSTSAGPIRITAIGS